MFAKINNDFLDKTIDYFQFDSKIAVDTYYSEARKGGSQFLLIKNPEYYWSTHLKDIFAIKPIVRYAIFTGEGLVTPHVDGRNDSVALNFYLQVGNDATIFYDKTHAEVKPYPNTNAYRVNELREVGRFYANKFDTYLMDVQKIHGIDKSGSEDRILISYRWRGYSFEQIYNSINTDKILWNEI